MGCKGDEPQVRVQWAYGYCRDPSNRQSQNRLRCLCMHSLVFMYALSGICVYALSGICVYALSGVCVYALSGVCV